jgi:hypothetical protein
MRRNSLVSRAGLSLVAAVVLLTGCSGSGKDDSASSSSKASSSASKTSAEAAGSEFCTKAAEALSEVEPAFTGGSDPTGLAPALQQAADKVRSIDPPSEISDDWAALADGIEQFAQAFASVNLNDPASATQLEQRTNELIGSLSTSATNVQNYLASKCGLQAPTVSSTPTG